MAYVPKCMYDVFLSYSHENNPEAEPWVDRFKDLLESSLRQELTISGSDRRLVVWQDKERLKPSFSLNQSLRDALSKTAVMVSLFSPSYLGSSYCADERRVFAELSGSRLTIGGACRLVNVIIRSPNAVRQHLPADLIYANLSSEGGALAGNSQELIRLTQGIKTILELMRSESPKVFVSFPGTHTEANLRATGNVQEILEDLSQAGYARTSEVQPDFLSDEELEDEVRQAELAIHIIADASDPLTVRQIEAAIRVRAKLLVWFRDGGGSGAEELKTRITACRGQYSTEVFTAFMDRVKEVLQNGNDPSAAAPPTGRTVFVVHNPHKDRDAAESLRRRLVAGQLDVTFDVQDWEKLDGVLVYHKEADDNWFESKIENVVNRPVVRAACLVSPPDKGRAARIAADFQFVPNPKSPRLLITDESHDGLRPFIEAVRAR